jgi:hypothetical protein
VVRKLTPPMIEAKPRISTVKEYIAVLPVVIVE